MSRAPTAASLVAAIALCGSPFVTQQSSYAQTFDALCQDDLKCKVSITGSSLSVGSTLIQANRIVKWGEVEAKSKRKPELCLLSLTACALTIFHDYRYFVEYADPSGETQKIDFRFINDKPAKQLVRDLTGLTNLASGQSSQTVEEWAKTRRQEVAYQKMLDSLNCSSVLKPYRCSYNTYLESNPAARAWATANPSLVKSQMIQMKAAEVINTP